MESGNTNTRGRPGTAFLRPMIFLLFILACSGANTTPPVSLTQIPTGTADASLSIAEQLSRIDEELSNTLSASIAYNTPQTMQLDESIIIELLLNPSMEPEELGEQVTESGPITTAKIEVTPRMKAELISQDEEAFIIKPLHDSPEQFISGSSTTQWNWSVTAREGGTHRLILIVHRLVSVDGVEEWRQIKTYTSDIEIRVSFGQRISRLDWKWIAGILITALLIPGFWRWFDARTKAKSGDKKSKRKKSK